MHALDYGLIRKIFMNQNEPKLEEKHKMRVLIITGSPETRGLSIHAWPHLIVQIHEIPLEVMRENVVLTSAAKRRG